MPIDISKDLNIDLNVISIATKTIDDVYNTGNPIGTYLPGKDFSPISNVSTGILTTYQIEISLSNKTNQSYHIDKLFLQSIDDLQTNGTGIIPLYYNNTDPNPQNITDDGNYTLVLNYNANMLSVVFGSNAGVTSPLTVNLILTVNYPNGIYWKTKIVPNIRTVAQKNAIQASGTAIKLEELIMSSTASLQDTFFRQSVEWGGSRVTTVNGIKEIHVLFYFLTSVLPLSQINTLLDSPNATTITYTADINFTMDGTNIPASLQSGSGVTIQSTSITGNKYTVVLNNSGNMKFPVVIRNNIFYDYYYKKRSEGKCHRVALSHICKKLIKVIYILETKNI